MAISPDPSPITDFPSFQTINWSTIRTQSLYPIYTVATVLSASPTSVGSLLSGLDISTPRGGNSCPWEISANTSPDSRVRGLGVPVSSPVFVDGSSADLVVPYDWAVSAEFLQIDESTGNSAPVLHFVIMQGPIETSGGESYVQTTRYQLLPFRMSAGDSNDQPFQWNANGRGRAWIPLHDSTGEPATDPLVLAAVFTGVVDVSGTTPPYVLINSLSLSIRRRDSSIREYNALVG